MCVNTKRNLLLIADHYIEPMSIPQDGFYFFEYCMSAEQNRYFPYYIMNRKCEIYKEAKKKYGKHIIPYSNGSKFFLIKVIFLLRRTKIVSEPYQIFHATVPGFAAGLKKSRYLYVLFTQHGVNFFKEKFIRNSSYSAFNFDKIIVSNEIEKKMFVERASYDPKDIVFNGLCRWDHIVTQPSNKTIFVFFTHRRYLGKIKNITDCIYFKTITGFITQLNNSAIVKEHGYRIKLALHHSVVARLGYDILSDIDIVKDEEIEAVKSQADILVTDYSSMCFEFWFQRKPVVFLSIHDYDDCISNGSLTDLLFPYKGKEQYLYHICNTAEEAIGEIEHYYKNGFHPDAEEEKLWEDFFTYHSDFCKRYLDYLLSVNDEKDRYVLPLCQEVFFSKCASFYVDNVDFPNYYGRWTIGKKADIAFYIPETKNDINIRLCCIPNVLEKQPLLEADFFVNGKKSGSEAFTANKKSYVDLRVPKEIIKDNFIKITIKFKKIMYRNQLRPGVNDYRYFGVNLISIAVYDRDLQAVKNPPAHIFLDLLPEKRDVFSKIYDITCNNFHSEDKAFPIEKDVFIYTENTDPFSADILALSEYDDNEEFAQAAYLKMLKRLPTEREERAYQKYIMLPAAQFQTKLIRQLYDNKEFQNGNVCAINNIYYKASGRAPKKPAKKPDRVKNAILSVARLQPAGIKEIEKEILKRLGIKY